MKFEQYADGKGQSKTVAIERILEVQLIEYFKGRPNLRKEK